MSKLTMLLGVLVMVCALGLVTSQHRARKLFVELERAQAQARELEVGWNRLQVDQTLLAKPALIDATARRALKLEQVSPSRSLYLPGTHGGTPASAAADATGPRVAHSEAR
jgi:cell division protein FtsL